MMEQAAQAAEASAHRMAAIGASEAEAVGMAVDIPTFHHGT